MGDGNLVTDLFGEPVQERCAKVGRPEAVWSRETSNRVLLAFALGWSVKRAADLVGLSTPTLRKVYFSECAKRKLARDKHELRQLELLAGEAEKGNVGASKELDKRLERLRVRDLGERIADRGRSAAQKTRPAGKKEQQKEAAAGVAGKFATREPPPQLVN